VENFSKISNSRKNISIGWSSYKLNAQYQNLAER